MQPTHIVFHIFAGSITPNVTRDRRRQAYSFGFFRHAPSNSERNIDCAATLDFCAAYLSAVKIRETKMPSNADVSELSFSINGWAAHQKYMIFIMKCKPMQANFTVKDWALETFTQKVYWAWGKIWWILFIQMNKQAMLLHGLAKSIISHDWKISDIGEINKHGSLFICLCSTCHMNTTLLKATVMRLSCEA